MPKINSPEQVTTLVPNLPHRLKELRLEMGWSLDDLVPVVGVTQKGVISNWEATNQRRRTPPISTLVILQRWYGVSLDYLVGHPKAERESADVKAGKAALRKELRQAQGVAEASPSERARRALRLAMDVAPEAFFLGRAAGYLGLRQDDLESLLNDRDWPDSSLRRLAWLLGLDAEWFYSEQPAQLLDRTS
ncbi:MAG TPA: helix-turn-helix transcriptional regulator [Symbiobacteriaceae bacterium]|nr:helix-turn-helix transcriptional regulator [Symbiobacteriaceae bacterium]